MRWGLAACAAPAPGGKGMGRFGATTRWLGCLVLGVAAAGWHLAITGARRRRRGSLRTLLPEVSPSVD